MKKSLPVLVFGLLLTASFSAEPASRANALPLPAVSDGAPPPQLTEPDRKWAELQVLLAPPAATAQAPAANLEARALARQRQAQRFLQAADAAKAFAAQNPEHAKAREARRAAAKSLLQASMVGDVSREAEAKQLVEEIRRDQDLPAKARLELVSLSEIVRLRPLIKDRVKYLAAHEQSARALIVEFPQEPAAYEALVRMAENAPEDTEAIRLAQDVMNMPSPAGVKAAARTLLDRHALVGQSLTTIAESALGKDNPISKVKGRGVVLYAWATFSPGSINAAKNLAKSVPPDTQLVGINFDKDVAAAQAKALGEGLPGVQIYDERGYDSPLAQALKLRRLGEVYVTNRQGVIRSISAQRGDLTGKLGQAGL